MEGWRVSFLGEVKDDSSWDDLISATGRRLLFNAYHAVRWFAMKDQPWWRTMAGHGTLVLKSHLSWRTWLMREDDSGNGVLGHLFTFCFLVHSSTSHLAIHTHSGPQVLRVNIHEVTDA